MLGEYVDRYIEAYRAGDKKLMKNIERDLSIVGMDKYTLMILVGEKMKEDK